MRATSLGPDVGLASASVTLSASSRQLLRRGGFTNLRACLAISSTQLARELNVDPLTALRLQNEARGALADVATAVESSSATLAQLTSPETGASSTLASKSRFISTGSRALDELLGGGVALGALTEFAGVPGAGKTQIAMQLAVTCASPEAYGGLDGGCAYLDTEGSFSVERALDMATANAGLRPPSERAPPPASARDALSRIHYFRAYDAGEQLAFTRELPRFLSAHPDVRLVVVDSAAFHFRHHDSADLVERTRTLMRHAQQLHRVAHEHAVAVVLTNHMLLSSNHRTASSLPSNGEDPSATSSFFSLTPALGDSWSHSVTHRVVVGELQQRGGEEGPDSVTWRDGTRVKIRRAELVKSPCLPQRAVNFVVVAAGVRGVPGRAGAPSRPGDATPLKRPKLEG